MHTNRIRPFRASDLPVLEGVIDATGLFPGSMLEEMVQTFLSPEPGEEMWWVFDSPTPVGLAYCAPERMTSGTWNLLLIAVHPEEQKKGVGRALMSRVENELAQRQQRILLVETSSLPEFEGTRGFYRLLGYEEEARIRDFYQDKEDKIVFRKAISSAST